MDEVSAAIYVTRFGTSKHAVLGPRLYQRTDLSPKKLSALAQKTWGVECFLLHDGGLQLGANCVTIVLEALADFSGESTVTSEIVPDIPNRKPWQFAGWYSSTFDWVSQQLVRMNHEMIGRLDLVSTNDLACVLRVDTTAGPMYVKTGESGFEAAATAALAGLMPDHLPDVVAVDHDRKLLLTVDAGKRLSEVENPDAWRQAVLRLAGLHRTEVSVFPPKLLLVHEFHQSLRWSIELLGDSSALRAWRLPGRIVSDLLGRSSEVEAAYNRVASLEIPECVVHGDAHAMNVALGAKGAVWFDWSEVAVAHPLTDAGWFFAWLCHPAREALPVKSTNVDLVDQLWHAYLQAIGVPEAANHLDDAITIALAHRAATYHLRFKNWHGTVADWQPGYTPYYLRWLLNHLHG